MKLKLLALLLLLTGCTGQAISKETPPPAPEVITSEELSGRSGGRRLTLKLTLSSPDDLLVREGDRLQEGEIVADRVRDRSRLEVQLERLRLQTERLSKNSIQPPPVRPVPDVAGLPPANFLSEVAEVESKRLLVEAAARNLQNQQRLVDMLTIRRDVPEEVLAHETVVLEERQREVDQAKAQHLLAQGKLSQAQNERQFQEYQHSVTIANRQIQLQQNELERQGQWQRWQEAERNRSFQLAQVETQRQQIETQLLDLGAIRAPMGGRITRIKWAGQNDQNLIVELTLLVDDSDDGGGSSSPNQAGETLTETDILGTDTSPPANGANRSR